MAKPTKSKESAIDILARIWPEFDSRGTGIMADMMEEVLRRVEQEQGTSLLDENAWSMLGDYIATVAGTIVSQKDLGELLTLLQRTKDQTAATDHTPTQDEPTEQRGQNDMYLRSEPQAPTQSHLHHHHQSSVPYRPRPPSAIRKISLSESTQFSPRPRAMRESSPEQSDESEHHSSPRHDSRGTYSGTSSPSYTSREGAGNMKDYRTNYNQMSIREPSQTEYEGVGLDADYEPPESDLRLHDYMVMQKKLTQSKIEYDATLKQREEEDLKNKQQLEDMRRDLKQKQREIAMLKSNEDFKTKQINELKDQIEITEKTSSTQKNSAATLKKQKDELEAENNRMQESLKEKEEVLHYAMARLSAKEADSLRFRADQEVLEQLRERLAEEITKNEAMARTLELMNSEKLQQRIDDTENLSGGHDVYRNSTSDDVQYRTLGSELASVDAAYGVAVDLDRELDGIKQESSDMNTRKEGAQRLLEESRRLKRSSISQRNGSKELSQNTPSALTTAKEGNGAGNGNDNGDVVGVVVLKHRADDVDCELPLELQRLENKEMLLRQEIGAQETLIEELFKVQQESAALGEPFGRTPFGSDMVLGQKMAGLTSIQKSERARRRKVQTSRVVTADELADVRIAGPSTSTMAVARRENKNVIANVTLVSMYTIVVYLFGVITSVFLVDNGHTGAFNYGQVLDAFQDVAVADMNGGPGRFKVFEILVYWLQNLVWQGDAGFVPT